MNLGSKYFGAILNVLI